MPRPLCKDTCLLEDCFSPLLSPCLNVCSSRLSPPRFATRESPRRAPCLLPAGNNTLAVSRALTDGLKNMGGLEFKISFIKKKINPEIFIPAAANNMHFYVFIYLFIKTYFPYKLSWYIWKVNPPSCWAPVRCNRMGTLTPQCCVCCWLSFDVCGSGSVVLSLWQ